MALNMGMLASYDQSVEFCKDSLGFGEGATVLGKILCMHDIYILVSMSINFSKLFHC
jgi:hypothetical protein